MKKPYNYQDFLRPFFSIKLDLKMKFSLFLLLIGIFQLQAENGYAQKTKITLNVRSVSVIDVMNEIETTSDFRFFYSKDDLNLSRRITIKANEKDIRYVLSKLFNNSSVSFRVIEKQIVLTPRTKAVNVGVNSNTDNTKSTQEPIVVTGTVTDDEGVALPGVNIVEKGTSNGVSTNFDGEYNIEVSDKSAVLVFSYLGFKNQELPVGESKQINVTMAVDAETLGEVVVVGYGTQEREDVTSAISSVKAADIVRNSVPRLDQALQGRIPGVAISTNDASPGGEVSIRIRGFSTAAQNGDNSPLFIIDGVPTKNGIDLLNPNDIASVDVLKDAAASSIYGVQAANGVVVITTKRGTVGKSSLTLNMHTGIGEAWRQNVQVLNPREQAIVNNIAVLDRNTRPDGSVIQEGEDGFFPQNPFYTDPQSLPLTGTDWQKVIFRAAPFSDLNLAFNGGTEQTQYAMSAGYRSQKGVIINSDFVRYSIRGNVDHKATDFLKLGTNFIFSQNELGGVDTNINFDSVTFSALGYSQLFQPRRPDGQYDVTPVGPVEYWGGAKHPLATAERADRRNIRNAITGSLYAELDLLKNLEFKSLFGYSRFFGTSKIFTQPAVKDEDGINNPAVSNLNENSSNSVNLNWDNFLTYSKNDGSHDFTAVVGSSAQSFSDEFIFTRQDGFTDTTPSRRFIGFGDPNRLIANSNRGERSLLSFFGRLNYSYKNKYILQAVLRRDGASVFAEDLRWGTFPAFSVGWNIAKENFLQDSKVITNMKLRGSFGESGNFNLGDNYLIFNRLSAGSNYPFGGSLQPGVRPSQLGNRTISWETNDQLNVGLDVSLFNNKLDFTVDYYKKTTRDMLIRAAIPAVGGGAEAPPQNLGRVLNRGVEFAVSYNGSIGKDFNFNVTANGATLTNEVLDLGGDEFVITDNSSVAFRIDEPVTRAVVGSTISSFFGYQFDGIYQNEAEIANGPTPDTPNVQPGDVRWKDISGPDGVPDGIISPDDRTVIGDPIPDFTYGFTLNAQYKNIDFSTLFQGVSGVDIFSLVYRNLNDDAGGGGNNRLPDALNAWSGEGSTNTFPRISFNDPADNYRVSDRYIFDGDYLRLRNIELGYTFPETIVESLGMRRFRFYVAAQNLFTLTNYFSFDPEVGQNTRSGGGNRDLELGIDKGVYPLPRNFLMGVNITF
ncbi:SusC/RagA family TonB-linked outer membrane protein [Maribacter sp. 2307ULW6-5]|uniref:SusC/RagA family TonB-linked outer membrane protein n=1 Tax=Maribacter sp. 2307ULW6-5 TaxID=3386275 RepID=UPI0039BC89C8